jgi:hypothetical protein
MSEDDYDIDVHEIDPVEFCFWCPDCLESAALCRCGMTDEREN